MAMPSSLGTKVILQHLAGYAAGVLTFLIIIPLAIWLLSTSAFTIFPNKLFSSDILRISLAMILSIIGLFFIIWSNAYLFFKGKGGPTDIAELQISPRTKYLVTQGPYRYTRNPMVFGTNSLYLSIIIYLNSIGCLLLFSAFFAILVKFIVLKEEERLINDFGDQYHGYKERTSMFIPWPPKN